MKSSSSPSDLEAGRAAYAERRWREACDRLAQADRECPLAGEDLDRLAWSFALLGQNDLLFATLERLYNVQLDAGDLRGAAPSNWVFSRVCSMKPCCRRVPDGLARWQRAWSTAR